MAKRRSFHNSASQNADLHLITGTNGNDDIIGRNANDEIRGLDGDDSIRALYGDDVLFGGAGRDTLKGNAGDDKLHGDGGADELYGGKGNDRLYGNHGEDTLDGGEGADKMFGGTLSDRYIVDDPGDVVVENEDSGDDSIYASVSYTIPANVEYLQLVGYANIDAIGDERDNALGANRGDNVIWGGAGNDLFVGSTGGVDVYYGGTGDDTYRLGRGANVTIVEYENEGIDFVDALGSYTLHANIENATIEVTKGFLRGNELGNVLHIAGGYGVAEIFGEGGNDTITGGDFWVMGGIKAVYGGDGDDDIRLSHPGTVPFIYGGAGNDYISGGYSGGIYTGGEGADRFSGFNTSTDAGHPIVTDFESGVDKIIIGNHLTNFTGVVTAEQVHYGDGATAQTAAHRMVLDTETGNLYYDPDGSGAQAMQFMGTLEGAQSISHTDFAVV